MTRGIGSRAAAAVEAVAEARQKGFDVGIDDLIVSAAALAVGFQEAASLEEPQVFTGDMRGDATGFSQFTDPILFLKKHLQHS